MSYFLIQYWLLPEEIKNYIVPKSALTQEAIDALYCVNNLMRNVVEENQEQTNAFDLIGNMVTSEVNRDFTSNPDHKMTCVLGKFLVPENCTLILPEGTEFIRTGFYL